MSKRAPVYPQHKNAALENFRREEEVRFHREMQDKYRAEVAGWRARRKSQAIRDEIHAAWGLPTSADGRHATAAAYALADLVATLQGLG